MNRSRVGLLILLVACELLGLGAAQWFYRVFQVTVPAAMLTDFNRLSAHAMYLVNGSVLGFVLFLWCLAVLAIAPVFRSKSKTERGGPPQGSYTSST